MQRALRAWTPNATALLLAVEVEATWTRYCVMCVVSCVLCQVCCVRCVVSTNVRRPRVRESVLCVFLRLVSSCAWCLLALGGACVLQPEVSVCALFVLAFGGGAREKGRAFTFFTFGQALLLVKGICGTVEVERCWKRKSVCCSTGMACALKLFSLRMRVAAV